MAANFIPIPEIDEILKGDLDVALPDHVRNVLLDMILTWANLDMATALFLTSVLNLTPDEGAERFRRKEIAEKLKRASSALAKVGANDISAMIGKIASQYPEMSLLRRRIAHSKCAGVRSSNQRRVIFLPFESEGPPGNLAVEVIDLSKFKEATAWAKGVHDYLMDHVDKSGLFAETSSA